MSYIQNKELELLELVYNRASKIAKQKSIFSDKEKISNIYKQINSL